MNLYKSEFNRYVEFDGEVYLMTAPLMSMIQEIKDTVQAKELTLPKDWTAQDGSIRDFYVIWGKPDRIEVGLSTDCNNPFVYYSTKTKKYRTAEPKDSEYWPVPIQQYWPSTTYFPVCPMLIPLNQDGQLDLRVIGFQQNGMLTKGGTAYISAWPGGKMSFFAPGAKPQCIGNLKSQFSICDSSNKEEDNLTWMCWNGCLILCDTIVLSSMESFWHSWIPWPCQELFTISEYQQALQASGIEK